MSDKKNQPRTKQLPKGQRTHLRGLKPAARMEAGIDNPQSSPVEPAPTKQEPSL